MFHTCMLCGVCGEARNHQHIGPWPPAPIGNALHGRWPKSYARDPPAGVDESCLKVVEL